MGFPHGMSVKFGLWIFMNFQNGRKILTLLTFGCPSNQYLYPRFWS